MKETRTINLVEIPISGHDSRIWNRLHSEREDLCEALVNDSSVVSDYRRGLHQSRLRKIDDALDRLMSGSYGICPRCGQSIERTLLDVDPALSTCLACSVNKSRINRCAAELELAGLI